MHQIHHAYLFLAFPTCTPEVCFSWFQDDLKWLLSSHHNFRFSGVASHNLQQWTCKVYPTMCN